ncbi:hypothetical protein LTR36_009519 [Oleoguttula mirabilis]|uniref:N-acetyltransferase domain-containing protein n=1 Tax=Oleoguttula mirabilis TaxID=1507867 RepID=A0AAV9JSW6_9PEZI|nr:hypothetical protein LTR36_009519 [Oleoguttula mirabilis]
MGTKVLEAEDADMYRIFEIASLAFAKNEPMWDVMWPKHWLDSGRQVGAERMRQIKHTDPHTKYMKAVEEGSGAIMGFAKWNIYDNSLPDLDAIKAVGDFWDNDEEKMYATSMTQLFLEERNAAIKQSDGNLVSLDILTIDPAYQRKGVGDALVKWGTQTADELGVEAIVESSPPGRGLYEKNGYVFVKDVVMRAPGEQWKDRPEAKFAWLIRPKKQ